MQKKRISRVNYHILGNNNTQLINMKKKKKKTGLPTSYLFLLIYYCHVLFINLVVGCN